MTEEQKLEIARLRKLEWGFKQIGQALNIDRDAVRYYCKGQGLDSAALQENDNECYVKDRFWRKENVTQIVECLITGKKPEFIPQWIKEIITSWVEESTKGVLLKGVIFLGKSLSQQKKVDS